MSSDGLFHGFLLQEIQGSLDQGHIILHTVLESCDKTVPNTGPAGVHTIRNEAKAAKVNYENLIAQVSQVRVYHSFRFYSLLKMKTGCRAQFIYIFTSSFFNRWWFLTLFLKFEYHVRFINNKDTRKIIHFCYFLVHVLSFIKLQKIK